MKKKNTILRATDASDDAEILRGFNASDVDAGQSLMMWMPGGTHDISLFQGDKPVARRVTVNQDSAKAAQASLEKFLKAGGPRPFFDFNHMEAEASAWPQEFTWCEFPVPGVYARVEWTGAGKRAVDGKVFRAFSPAFYADKATPSAITGAPICMGGLVNIPAFKKILPLWATGGACAPSSVNNGGETANQGNQMTLEELAAKEAAAKQLADENIALKAKNAELEKKAQEDRKLQAKNAVDDAVKRGVIAPKDTVLQARWAAMLEADPGNIVLLASSKGQSLDTPITTPGGQVEIVNEDFSQVLRAYDAASKNPTEAGRIWTSDLARKFEQGAGDQILRATQTTGTLVGALVTQRALDLMALKMPLLSRISTDFSDESASYGQAITTRIKSVPSASDYSTSTGYATNEAGITDVAVTINAHKSVQIAYNANELGGTKRNLLDEQSEPMQYALTKVVTDALLALITVANFPKATRETVVALADLDRTDLTAMRGTLNARGVPDWLRFFLFNSDYYAKLGGDTTVVSNLYNPDAGRSITTGDLPEIAGFLPIEVPNLPTGENLTGFAGGPASLCMAARTPGDYAAAIPGLPQTAVKRIIKDPRTGLSVELTMFIDHSLGKAVARVALMYGVAKGDATAGQRLCSAASS